MIARYSFVLVAVLLGIAPAVAAPPPEVTAKGWAILDGKTGKFLWGKAEDECRKAASTTKVMCAYVVLQLAAKDPKVLDEVVTFSKLADDTVGSTADVKVGESVPVKDLLYGLLLPSGNDAGNALAEHFNARLAPPEEEVSKKAFLHEERLSTRRNFIAEMNRQAKKLDLKNTLYSSVFGDGPDHSGPTISPKDLGTLGWNALQNERFREIVKTKKYECQVKKPDGTTRTAVWTNTNRLLNKPGYDGIKTGTNNAASACLVASGHKGDDHLIVVVLGSKTEDSRYVDTEALFAWGWANR